MACQVVEFGIGDYIENVIPTKKKHVLYQRWLMEENNAFSRFIILFIDWNKSKDSESANVHQFLERGVEQYILSIFHLSNMVRYKKN